MMKFLAMQKLELKIDMVVYSRKREGFKLFQANL